MFRVLILSLTFLLGNAYPSEPSEKSDTRLETYEDFASFYERVLGAGEYSTFKLNNVPFKSAAELLDALRKTPTLVRATPWIFSRNPEAEVRKIGYDLLLAGGLSEGVMDDESLSLISGKEKRISFLKDPKAVIKSMSDTDLSILDPKARNYTSLDRNIAGNSFVRWVACLRLEPLAAKKCARAVARTLELMTPYGGYTAIPVLKRVLSDGSYAEPAAKAALKIMARVDTLHSSSVISPGDLFSDILASFTESGFSLDRSEEMTWDLIAVYASRGPNVLALYQFVSGKPASRTLLALETIAMGTSVLDAASHLSGHLYSLPKEIFTVANYGKPYHFWMSAFIAWKMSRDFNSPKAGRAAGVIAQLGYQMFSTTDGRANLFESILTEGEASIGALKTKIDLNFGFAGAEYGRVRASGSLENFRIDIDYAMKKMMENPHEGAVWSAEQVAEARKKPIGKISAYLKWVREIRPMGILSKIESQNGCLSFLRPKVNSPFALHP